MRTLIRLPESARNRRVMDDQGFYTAAEASRIARVPLWTISEWRRQGVIVPSVEWENEQGKSESGYTFETLIFLRLIRMLREQRISLPKAVKVVQSLQQRFGPPGASWADARIVVRNQTVFVSKEDEWKTTVAPSHQKVFEQLLFRDEFARLKNRADALLIPKEYMPYVEIDPAIRNGLPIVLNTTVPTSIIRSVRQQGHTYAQIQAMYPFIPRRAVVGADRYEDFLDSSMSKVA